MRKSVLACWQGRFLLHTFAAQMDTVERYGLPAMMFSASETTIFVFELFYLFLYLCGLLKISAIQRVNRAKRFTALLFAVFMIFQIIVNTNCVGLKGELLPFIIGKNLCSLALLWTVCIADLRISISDVQERKPAVMATLLILSFFYSIYVFIVFVNPFAFVKWMGYAHFFLILLCIVCFLFKAFEGKRSFLGKALRVLCVLLLGMTVVYSAIIFPLVLAQHHRHVTADCTMDELDEVLLNADASDSNVIVCENDELYIFFPLYDDIRFATGSHPSKADRETIMVIPTAFTHAVELTFSHDNIEGIHVDGGELYPGYNLEGAGAFTYANGQAEIWNEEEAEAALITAAEQGGCGYQQFMVLEDGEFTDFTLKRSTSFRAVTKWKNRICIVDSKYRVSYEDFCQMLKDMGIQDALYCEMGTRWNHSWFRKDNGKIKNLFGLPWRFSHSWLVFKKQV